LPIQDILSFLDLVILRQFRSFVAVDSNRKLTFEFCLPNIIHKVNLLAHHLLAHLHTLQAQKREVTAMLGFQKESTSIEVVDLLHLLWSQFEEESFTTVGVRDGNVSANGSKFKR